jgi:glycine/D-amino acid oxidase-like deaminating enzyme
MSETDPGPHGPTWYAATRVDAPERRALTHDLDVDVCVIGAGLAGLTVAREVARRGWSVAVLETDRIGTHASGRNGGFVSPGFAERIDAIVERVGLPRARELWALSEAGVNYVRNAMRDTGMPGINPRDGRLTVRRTDDEAANIEHVAMLRVEFGADVEAWPTEQVREVLRSASYFQAVHYANAFHLHPLNYALGLAAAAESAGARIFEGTTATAVDPEGVRKRVKTSGGLIRAHHVVLAGNLQVGVAEAELGTTVMPISTYVAVTKPLGETLFDAVRYTGAVADTRRAGDYYRVVADDRLMWGGRFTLRNAPPRKLKSLMRRDMLRTYPQLAGVEIEYAWTGTMGYALHKMPQIGELAPGYWLLGAFGGHGLNTTAMAGELIARAILDGDDRWRLFSPYELVWAGGRLGRAAAQTVAWSMQARDALTERIARYRDKARREAARQQEQWAAEQAKRREEQEARRAAEEAKRAADEEAKRAEEEMRRAELQVRRASEQARRAIQVEAARRARERVEAARRERTGSEAASVIDAATPLATEAPVVPVADTNAAPGAVDPAPAEPVPVEVTAAETSAADPVSADPSSVIAAPADPPAGEAAVATPDDTPITVAAPLADPPVAAKPRKKAARRPRVSKRKKKDASEPTAPST